MDWRWLPFDALTTVELYALLKLRAEVFVVEQRCAYADVDGLDPAAHHLLGCVDGALTASLRAFPPPLDAPHATIGRVVVAPAWRGRGTGDALMRRGVEACNTAWPGAPIRLNAQAHLEGWYQRLGFRRDGLPFDEDGIPHVPMFAQPT
jgi:ElaA protein